MDKIRHYDRFISLGLNCETSFILHKRFGPLESSLFQWAAVPAENFIEVLNNLSLIYSGKIIEDPETNMWKCAVTNISFHGQHNPQQLLDDHGSRDKEKVRAECKDTMGRIRYQCEKFLIVAKSAETKLYIVGLQPYFCPKTKEECFNFVKELYAAIQKIASNASLLVIAEENQRTEELMALDNDTDFFIRFIDHFASYLNATSFETMDIPGYAKIYQEFCPDKLAKKEKKYKFEQE